MAARKKSRTSRSSKRKLYIRLAAVLIVIILLFAIANAILYFVSPQTFNSIYAPIISAVQGTSSSDGDDDHSHGGSAETPLEGEAQDIISSDLSIHFIKFENDKAGDCTLIKCGDTEVLIDAGSTQSSAATIKNYLENYCTDGVLEYVIATHADQDHIAGLVGTSSGGVYNGILYSYEIGTIIKFDLSNKDVETAAGNRTLYGKFLDAVESCELSGAAVYNASECCAGSGGAAATYYLNDEQTVSINILNNYYYTHKSSDENNYSVCMLLKQEVSTGEFNNYLFTGDLEEEGEEYLVQLNQLPEVELFKAGHHGSPTSSNDCLLSVIKPKYVTVCCCAGTDEYTSNKNNQFPSQAFIDRVSKYTDNVYVTNMVSDNAQGYEPMNGDIVFYVQEEQIKLWCSNNTTKLKDTDWFKANRTGWGVTATN